ncbi:MAG: hypothetical protein M0R03_17190 [Novosphingobium sp.]|nr:hypothetical protein [Novosphingobium sp.]
MLALLFLLLIIPLTLLRGWVLLALYKWFIIPLGAPEISMAHALGVALIVGFLTHTYTGKKDRDEKIEEVIQSFLVPIIALIFGWVYQSFL